VRSAAASAGSAEFLDPLVAIAVERHAAFDYELIHGSPKFSIAARTLLPASASIVRHRS
jgi:hypothetical protein